MEAEQPAEPRYRRRGAAALRLHLALALALVVCLTAAVFQLIRALGGNDLSWAYTVEWPLFAVFAVYVWWRLLHDDGSDPAPPSGELDEGEAARLDAFNDYLAELREADRREGR